MTKVILKYNQEMCFPTCGDTKLKPGVPTEVAERYVKRLLKSNIVELADEPASVPESGKGRGKKFKGE